MKVFVFNRFSEREWMLPWCKRTRGGGGARGGDFEGVGVQGMGRSFVGAGEEGCEFGVGVGVGMSWGSEPGGSGLLRWGCDVYWRRGQRALRLREG